MVDAELIRSNLAAVHRRIDDATEAAGRDPGEVRLLLATKTQPPEAVRVAIEAGEKLVADYLPDLLHPNGDWYEIMGSNFAEKMIDQMRLMQGAPAHA